MNDPRSDSSLIQLNKNKACASIEKFWSRHRDRAGVKINEKRKARNFKGPKCVSSSNSKVKGLPQQAEVAQGVPGRLRPRIFLTLGTARVIGRQPVLKHRPPLPQEKSLVLTFRG